jgi:hypothetical protein
MGVQFIETNHDRIPQPRRREYLTVIQRAIETCRRPDEEWTVTTHVQPESTTLVFDLALGHESARWFTYRPELDNQAQAGLFKTASLFLRNNWTARSRPIRSVPKVESTK